MRAEHVNDSMDYVKGGIIRILRKHKLITKQHPLVIATMRTDDDWKQDYIEKYKDAIEFKIDDCILHDNKYEGNDEYYSNISYNNCSIFFDPNTGLQFDDNDYYKKFKVNYFRKNQIKDICNKTKFIIAYQHGQRKQINDTYTKMAAIIPCDCFHVSIMYHHIIVTFISNKLCTIKRIYCALKKHIIIARLKSSLC